MNFEQRVLNVVEPELDRIIRRFYPSEFDPSDCIQKLEDDNRYERQEDPNGKDILDILLDIWDLLQSKKKQEKKENPRPKSTDTRPVPETRDLNPDVLYPEDLTPGQRNELDRIFGNAIDVIFYDGMGDIIPDQGIPDYLLRAWNEQSTEEKFRLAPESEGGPEGNTIDGRPQSLDDLIQWFETIHSLPPVIEPMEVFPPLINSLPSSPYLPSPVLPLPAPPATPLEYDPDEATMAEQLETLLTEFRECCAWMRQHIGTSHSCQPEMLVHLMKTRVARRCP